MWGKKKKPKLDENGKPIPEQKKLADKDKIFNNTYGDQDITENRVNFTVAATYGDSMDINRVYSHIIEKIGDGYTRVDLFSVISDYFDVFPNKFYNSLSNKFKDELIKELDDKYNILEKRKIRKLF